MLTVCFCEPLWKTDSVPFPFTFFFILCSSSCLKCRHCGWSVCYLKAWGQRLYPRGTEQWEMNVGSWELCGEEALYQPWLVPFWMGRGGLWEAIRISGKDRCTNMVTSDVRSPSSQPLPGSMSYLPRPQRTSDLLWKLVFGWKFPLQIQMTMSESALKFLMLLAPTFFDKIHVNKAHLGKNICPRTFQVSP